MYPILVYYSSITAVKFNSIDFNILLYRCLFSMNEFYTYLNELFRVLKKCCDIFAAVNNW